VLVSAAHHAPLTAPFNISPFHEKGAVQFQKKCRPGFRNFDG
jgi:hypothetical protein